MKSSSVLFVGCGDLGIRTATLLSDKGWQVAGVRRDPGKLPGHIEGYAADYTRRGSLDFVAGLRPDFVVATFNPFERSVDGYRAGFQKAMEILLAGLGSHRPRHIIMASSTRVFAETCGGWVDEESALTTDDPWGLAIIGAERQLLSSPHNACVVRFAGIYGIPGGRLLARVSRGELCPAQPVSYTNRIHREDCAGFLAHLLQRSEAGRQVESVYIGVDDRPAPRYEVESWLAGKMGMAAPMERHASALEQPTQHNTAGHRRCSNKRLRDSGYELRYPDYESGYGELLGTT